MARAGFITFALLFGAIFIQTGQGQQGCADQLQQCGSAAEQYEQQIRAMKAVAFRSCISQPACSSEMVAFDECFVRSMRAVRNPSAQTQTLTRTVGDLMSTAEQFRNAVDRCFSAAPSSGSSFTSFGRPTGSVVDSDEAYVAAIYSADFADALWGMRISATSYDQSQIGCSFSTPNLAQRLFGNGISRTVDSADPRFNNLNTSCNLNELELQCYRSRLEGDPRYQELFNSRNQAFRTCIQSIRLQTQCRSNSDGAQMQSCLCSAREEFELRLQKDLLECVRLSPVGRRQTASLLGSSVQIFPPDQFGPNRGAGQILPPDQFGSNRGAGSDRDRDRDRFSQTLNQQLTPGIVRNGQCLCACQTQNSINIPQTARPQVEGSRTLNSIPSSSSWPWYQNNQLQYPSDGRNANANTNGNNGNWQPQYPDYAQSFESYYWNNPARWSGNRYKEDQPKRSTDINSDATTKSADSD